MMMQSGVFQTLADPTRLRIVEALAGGEQAVGDLVRAVDIDQSGVSRHLRILGQAVNPSNFQIGDLEYVIVQNKSDRTQDASLFLAMDGRQLGGAQMAVQLAADVGISQHRGLRR